MIITILKLLGLGILLLSGYAIWRWTMEEKALIEYTSKFKWGRDQDSDAVWNGGHIQ